MYIGDRAYFLRHILDTNETQLSRTLADIEGCYRTFQIPKRGGTRTIQAIDRASPLYGMQKALYRNFLDHIPLPIPAVGFVQDESYLTFLKPHIGRQYYLRLDIQDFFGTITTGMIRSQFAEFFSKTEPENLSDFLTLCTLRRRLPQGAVTSPAVSNVVFRRVDQRILKYCQSFDMLYQGRSRLHEDIRYTRYADDLLFSSSWLDFSRTPYFTGMIANILKNTGFQLNKGKSKYGKGEISLSGFVISQDVHLSRKKLGPLNQLLHFLGPPRACTGQTYRIRKAFFLEPDWLEQINALNLPDGRGGLRYFHSPQDLLDCLCGWRALLLSVLRVNDTETGAMRQLSRKVDKLELVIDHILKVTARRP